MVTDLWSFLGFTNYYSHFIKGYTKVTHPLYDQISGDSATQKKKKILWTEECQEAFDALKAPCTSAQILTFTYFTKSLKLHMDTSTTGLGAILYQEQGRKDQGIGYTSRALCKSKSCYPAGISSLNVGCY